MGGLFLCHAGALVLGAIFTFVFVPETRNKSLTQLEQIFKKSGNSEDKVWKLISSKIDQMWWSLYSGKLKSLHTDNVHYTAGGATCVEINKLINPGSPPDLGPTLKHCLA